MTGKKLVEELQKLTPEQLEKLQVVFTYTEYGDPEDSCGYSVEDDVDSVNVYNEQIVLGW